MKHFETLSAINLNDKTEKKKDLKYLSWAHAWDAVKKVYPDAVYKVLKFNGLPYGYDENTGYMVYTEVTIENITHEMWLPVMDGANNAMKNEQYEYTTKYGKKIVEAATMFDVNKTLMRCLTKNLAMFGLGLYIYAGEDLPLDDEEKAEFCNEEQKQQFADLLRAKWKAAIEKLDKEQVNGWAMIIKSGNKIKFSIFNDAMKKLQSL